MRKTLTGILLAALFLSLFSRTACAEPPRFYPVDIFIVSPDAPLAAWQVEITFPSGGVEVAGVEGGDAPYAAPAYYDPAGLGGSRLVLASFTLDDRPPTGRVKVATVHLMERISGARLSARLVLAADPEGVKTEAAVEMVERKGETR